MKDYTAGQLNAIIKKIRDQFGDDGPMMLLRDELELTQKEEQSLLGTPVYFTLEAVSKHDAKECIQNAANIKFWRVEDLDSLTPRERKAYKGGIYQWQSLDFRTGTGFYEIAAAILGIDPKEGGSFKEMQEQLIANGHTVEIKQIINEIKRNESGERKTLSQDKDSKSDTIFFVENYDGCVSPASVHRYAPTGEWSVNFREFSDCNRFYPPRRIVSRYSESS